MNRNVTPKAYSGATPHGYPTNPQLPIPKISQKTPILLGVTDGIAIMLICNTINTPYAISYLLVWRRCCLKKKNIFRHFKTFRTSLIFGTSNREKSATISYSQTLVRGITRNRKKYLSQPKRKRRNTLGKKTSQRASPAFSLSPV